LGMQKLNNWITYLNKAYYTDFSMKLSCFQNEDRSSTTTEYMFGMHDVIIPVLGYLDILSREGSICNVQNAKGLCSQKSISITFDLFTHGNAPGAVSCWIPLFCRIGPGGMISLLAETPPGVSRTMTAYTQCLNIRSDEAVACAYEIVESEKQFL